ncbi:MAG: peptidase MA family metallohydrolase [Deltaproteobacteria bacterium]
MRNIILLGALLLGTTPAAAEVSFKEMPSRHFEIYYEAPVEESFVNEVVAFAEKYYEELTEKLGFVRYNYWTWDDRAKIYIYADQETYVRESGQPAWSGGVADYHEKAIWTFPRDSGFFDSLLPHEIGHIVFREVIGHNAVPLWLEEGVASYLEPARRFGAKKMVADAIEDGSFIPLTKLNGMSPRGLGNNKQVELFYAESVGLLSFLIDEFGIDRFNQICDKIKEGKSFERAIKLTLFGVQNLDDLDKMWQDSLKKKDSLTRRTML